MNTIKQKFNYKKWIFFNIQKKINKNMKHIKLYESYVNKIII